MELKKKDFLTINKVYVFFTLLLVTLLIAFNVFHYYQPENTLATKLFSFGILLVALLAVFFFKIFIKDIAQRTLHSNQFLRAEQALSCINEVVITTNLYGKIIFCNASAGQWLGNKSIASVIGEPIQNVFPYPGMPWLDRWSNMQTNGQIESHGETLVDFNGYLITLNISQHYSKPDETEPCVIWVLRDVSRQASDRELLDVSRARYRALYEGSGVGMWHVDIALVREWLTHLKGVSVQQYLDVNPKEYASLLSSFNLIDVNSAALTLINGSTKEDFILKARKLFMNDNKTLMVQMAQHISDDKKKFAMEIEFKNIKSTTYHYLANVTLDLVAQDQALLSFSDITEQIVAQKKLQESENFWASVLQTLPDTVYVNDLLQRREVYNNRHIASLLGYSDTEIEGIVHWRDLLHKDDIIYNDEAVKTLKTMQPGEVNENRVRLKHKNGSWRIMRFRDCIFNEKGSDPFSQSGRYYVGTVRDVTQEEDAKLQLLDSERRYRLLAEGMSDIVFTLDSKLKLSYISSSVTKMLGYPSAQVLRDGLASLFSGDVYRRLMGSVRADMTLAKGKVKSYDHVRNIDLATQTKNGTPIILEVQCSILHNESGAIEGVLASCRDVTQRRLIEQEARTASEVFDNSSESIIVSNNKNRASISKVNKAFTNLTGHDSHSVIGSNPMRYINKQNAKGVLRDVHSSLSKYGYWQGELNYLTKDGHTCPSWTGITALKDDNGQVQSHIIISSDISHRKISEAKIERLAYFDSLTNLPNRPQMHETLEKLMLEPGQHLALLFIDLDRFKPINDTMGHPVGDQVLKAVAQRLQGSIRSQDLVARMGGDEFTVIMPALQNSLDPQREIESVCKIILQEIQQPFAIGERQLYLTASVGVALFPQNSISGMELLRNADTAMYHAKARGKNNVQFYIEEMNIKAMERLELENNLHLALLRNEFELYYQAQWDTRKNEICGIEALLRWHRPGFGLVGPDKFIPVIEETGLIVPIGEWVLRTACEQIMEWQEAGFDVPKLAVNLSARQFKDVNMLDGICRIVDETGVDPELIELELTESILMDDIERTLAVLNEARKMGFRLSIDDFGTGYSSLSYLKQFPVNNLKIDQSFIKNLPHNLEDAQITRTIVSMANNLGLGVIAEGVENEAQRAFLQEVGCHKVQGYMYSHPVSSDVLAHDFLDSDQESEHENEQETGIERSQNPQPETVTPA
jgi:diguanylate cyclase (GGDEF)-like protein/PAS domain S-box-containing protein